MVISAILVGLAAQIVGQGGEPVGCRDVVREAVEADDDVGIIVRLGVPGDQGLVDGVDVGRHPVLHLTGRDHVRLFAQIGDDRVVAEFVDLVVKGNARGRAIQAQSAGAQTWSAGGQGVLDAAQEEIGEGLDLSDLGGDVAIVVDEHAGGQDAGSEGEVERLERQPGSLERAGVLGNLGLLGDGPAAGDIGGGGDHGLVLEEAEPFRRAGLVRVQGDVGDDPAVDHQRVVGVRQGERAGVPLQPPNDAEPLLEVRHCAGHGFAAAVVDRAGGLVGER